MSGLLRGPGAGRSVRPHSKFTRSLSYISAFMLFCMMGLTFADVIGRYFLNAPISGAQEIISFMLGITVFTAFPLVTRNRAHITVGILENFFRGRTRFFQQLVILIGTLVTVGFMSLLLWQQAETMRKSQFITEYLDLPFAPIVYVLSGLSGLAFILLLSVIWHYLKGKQEIEL